VKQEAVKKTQNGSNKKELRLYKTQTHRMETRWVG